MKQDLVYYPNLGWMCIDATDPKKGNWLRYVNWARSEKEQNLCPLEINRTIYYKTLKPIEPGEELLVWYNGEDNAEVAAAIEEERANNRSKKNSPKAKKGKKKTAESRKRGNKNPDTKHRRPESNIISADMKDLDQGPKEDEKPSVSAILSVEQTVVIQEMVNQDALPKFMTSIPLCKSQNLPEDRLNAITYETDKNMGDDNTPKESSEKDSATECEENIETLDEQKSTNEENSESSPKKKPVVKTAKTKGESYGDLLETFMFPCQYCERKFTTKQGLERHMHIHVSAINHAFKCRYCGKAFGTQINRRRHERRHEAGPKRKPSALMTSEENMDSQTPLNEASQKSADELNTSGILQDFNILDSEKDTQEILNCLTEENGESKELHPCKYCKKVFGTHTNVRRHQRRVHERHLIPKGVRRKGCLLEDQRLQTEQAQPTQNVYVTNTETEEDGEADDVYIMDISNNISENLNYYIDGKIQCSNSTSNCEVIEVESNSADIYGLNCLLSPVTMEISQKINASQTIMTELQKESSSSGQNDPKKRRTASPPFLPKIKTEVDAEPITATCSLNLPLSISVTDNLSFQKDKSIYLSSKLKQLLQTQDNNKLNPALLTEVPKLGLATSSSSSSPSILPTVCNRFKRRTSTPPSSPQHSPALRDFVKQGDGKTMWNDGLGSKIPKLENHESSPSWSLSGKDERENVSPLCTDEYKKSKDWTTNITFGNVCNQQPLDLSSGVKQRSENDNKIQVPWESVLDLSVHKKCCDSTESKELKGSNPVQPTCSGNKKKKPTTCMLQKVLLNEYNGIDATVENTSYLNRSPSSCNTEESVQPDISSCSPLPAVTSHNSPSSPVLQASGEHTHKTPPHQSPPHLTLTNVPSPQPCPPVLSVASSPPPLLPSIPSPLPDSLSSSSPISSCSSPLSNVSSQSPLPVLSPTGSLSLSPVPSDDDPSNSMTSLGPPTLFSSSSSSTVSSSSPTSSSSRSSSPPSLSVVSPPVNPEPFLTKPLKEEKVEEEAVAIEKPHMANEPETGKVPETFNKNFVCNVCELPFQSIKDLTKHLSVHAEEWPFKCEFCVQLFKDASDLSEHRFLLHGVGKIFVCSVCKKEFAFLCNLHQHQQDLHPDKEYTHHELEGKTLRPQNFTDPSKVNMDHIQSLPTDSLLPSQEEEGDLNDSSEELYTTIKIMASGEKTKEPDVRMGLNQHYPSFKPPPFQYHNRNPMGIGATATNFTTHNIPQTFTTAIRCTKCGKSVDNMPELHKHILVCASASDKKRYTPQKNPVPLKQIVHPKNGMVVLDSSGKNAFRRIGQPKKLNFSLEISKLSSNKLKLTALKKKNQLVHKAILQKNKSVKHKADLKRNMSDSESHVCPFCSREFTYVGSLNKHAAYSCPKKPTSPTSKKPTSGSSKKGRNASYTINSERGSSQRRRTADAEIKMQSTQTRLGKTRARSSGPMQIQLPCASLKSKQSTKYFPHVKSKKNSAAKHSNLLRMVRITPGEVKKPKAMAQSHSSQILRKPARKLHVRIQKSKAVLQNKSTLTNKKRLQKFTVKSRERINGPITRSSQLAASMEPSDNRREDIGKQELREFRNLL
uniref:PR domain zinc finger protein 2 isoform X2 n=1 Tax=Geotrypetes seraphini TaxID=260995 RepID=A0A6P8PQS5_GEOSA|nr:PR domain zinc finger protein 2 isoform X2 [Geotrypetes seraphini]